MGNHVSLELSFDQVLILALGCFLGDRNYVHMMETNLEALENTMKEVEQRRDDLLRRVEIEEEKGYRRLAQVQGWLSRVEDVGSQVNDLLDARSTETRILCLFGYCSESCISSFKYGEKVFKKLKDVEGLLSKGVFQVVAEKLPASKKHIEMVDDKSWNCLMEPITFGFESYMVVHNIVKQHDLGTLARSVTAFGVTELILVGRCDVGSSYGSASHVRFCHFHSLIDACAYLKEKDCDICGVEIADGASAINKHPFKRSTAFLLCNEGTGLSAEEYGICDFFVYIPQYGGGTASLNVSVAASIVLHHFGVWAGFSEPVRDRSKSIGADRPVRRRRRNFCAGTEESIVEEPKLRKKVRKMGFLMKAENGNSLSHLLNS